MQRIVIFQQAGNAATKEAWIRAHGQDLEIVRVVDVGGDLPAIIDEPGDLLPDDWRADLVLSYLRHPDLADELARMCVERGVALVASGKRLTGPGVFCPPTCCALKRDDRLGPYGRQFGAPALAARVVDGKVAGIEVARGSPCGSTWEAARAVEGLAVSEAVTRFGLEVQLRCQADPANWDPLWGKSPVHAAGKIHASALTSALEGVDTAR